MTKNGAGGRSDGSFRPLQYPLDLPTSANTSYFYIRVIKKEPRPLNSFNPLATNDFSKGADIFGGNIQSNIGQIILPMPLGVSDGNDADWADGTFNFLEGQAANAISNIFNGVSAAESFGAGFSALSTEAQKYFTDMAAQLSNAGINNAATNGVAASILKTFGSNITPNQLLSRNTGQVLNPNLELLFNGPTLRNHEFSFKLTPRSKKESDEVKAIIYNLKRSMAARAGGSAAFVASPYVFKIGFRQGGQDHPFLFSMKTCALKGLNVNYSASSDQNYSSYYDGSPTSLDLSMRFTELSPVYAEDYDEFSDGESGVGW